MKQVLCLLAVFSLIALTGAMAQTGIDGAILGVVTDANGGAVVGATVTVTNLDTSIQKIETTRPDGSFEIDALPQGSYSVSVSYSGFKTWTLAKTDLTIGERFAVAPALVLMAVLGLMPQLALGTVNATVMHLLAGWKF